MKGCGGALREIHRDGAVAWSVFRDDGAAVPVFWAWRGSAELPGRDVLLSMTVDAVEGLLAGVGLVGCSRWTVENLAAGLCWAATEIRGWEGEQWPVDLADPVEWADPTAPRVPFEWLRAWTVDGAVAVGTQQGDALVGLSFVRPLGVRELPAVRRGDRLPHPDLPYVRGAVRRVGAVFDTTTPDLNPGVLTEFLVQGDEEAALLIAAFDDGEDDWYPFGDSVAVLTDPAMTDVLGWLPPRTTWRFAPGIST